MIGVVPYVNNLALFRDPPLINEQSHVTHVKLYTWTKSDKSIV